MKNLNFSQALVHLKNGSKVCRSGWNGKGMWIMLVAGTPTFLPSAGSAYDVALESKKTSIDPHIDMYTALGTMQPGWLASQADMLSEDWEVVV